MLRVPGSGFCPIRAPTDLELLCMTPEQKAKRKSAEDFHHETLQCNSGLCCRYSLFQSSDPDSSPEAGRYFLFILA